VINQIVIPAADPINAVSKEITAHSMALMLPNLSSNKASRVFTWLTIAFDRLVKLFHFRLQFRFVAPGPARWAWFDSWSSA
jgi:hypothetical protein